MTMNKKETTTTNVQLNMRVSPEVKDAYQEFCADEECNQNEGVGLLLSRLEERGGGNSERNDQVAAFKHNLANLLALYEGSLVIAEDAQALARAGFADQIDQQAAANRALQESLERRESDLSAAQTAKTAAEEEMKRALERAAELQEGYTILQTQLADKDVRVKELMADLAQTKALYQASQEANKSLTDRLTSTDTAHADVVAGLRAEIKDLSDQLVQAERLHAKDMRDYAERIDSLRIKNHELELQAVDPGRGK